MGSGSGAGTPLPDARACPAGGADRWISLGVRARHASPLSRSRQPALVNHTASPLAHDTSLAPHGRTACSPLVVAHPTHPSDGDLQAATQWKRYSPLGVAVSVLCCPIRF